MSKNHFAFDGQIVHIETRVSKAGKNYWVVTVDDGQANIPVTAFSAPPAEGLHVEVAGKIGAYKDFAKLIECRITPCGATLKNAPVPAMAANHGDDVPQNDADLPF